MYGHEQHYNIYELRHSTMHGESCLAKDLDAAVCSGTTAAGGPSKDSQLTTSGLPVQHSYRQEHTTR